MAHVVPSRRVIFLGASNLVMSFPLVVEIARRMWSEPLEIMAAMGHGRSYGQDSVVLGRKISGIFPCALWQDLQNRAPLPTSGLVTDIGNDLLYGVRPDRLTNWVAGCLDHLAAAGATTVVTQLPMASIERLSDARFNFFRSLFFPRSQLTRSAILALAEELNDRLVSMGLERKISVISVSGEWYGFDPIHLKRRSRPRAWRELLASWREAEPTQPVARTSFRTSVYLNFLAPHERSLFGVRRYCAQPSGRLADGTTISLY